MTNADKILFEAALHLDLVARLIDDGAPVNSTSKRLRQVNDLLDDALFLDLSAEQDEEQSRLYSISKALRKEASWANHHGHHHYLWVDHPEYGWVIKNFNRPAIVRV